MTRTKQEKLLIFVTPKVKILADNEEEKNREPPAIVAAVACGFPVSASSVYKLERIPFDIGLHA